MSLILLVPLLLVGLLVYVIFAIAHYKTHKTEFRHSYNPYGERAVIGHKARQNYTELCMREVSVWLSVAVIISSVWLYQSEHHTITGLITDTLVTIGGAATLCMTVDSLEQGLLIQETILWLPCFVMRQVARTMFYFGAVVAWLMIKAAHGAVYIAKGSEYIGTSMAMWSDRKELRTWNRDVAFNILEEDIKQREIDLGLREPDPIPAPTPQAAPRILSPQSFPRPTEPSAWGPSYLSEQKDAWTYD